MSTFFTFNKTPHSSHSHQYPEISYNSFIYSYTDTVPYDTQQSTLIHIESGIPFFTFFYTLRLREFAMYVMDIWYLINVHILHIQKTPHSSHSIKFHILHMLWVSHQFESIWRGCTALEMSLFHILHIQKDSTFFTFNKTPHSSHAMGFTPVWVHLKRLRCAPLAKRLWVTSGAQRPPPFSGDFIW